MIHSHHEQIIDWIQKKEAASIINKIFRPLIKGAFGIDKPYKGEGKKLTEEKIKEILVNYCLKKDILPANEEKLIEEVNNLMKEEAFVKTLEGYKIYIQYK